MVDIDLDKLLKPEEKKDFESALYDVLKDMTDKKKVELLTELDDKEIKLMTRLMMLKTMRKNKIYEEVVNMFMLLRVSKGRQSRGEILKAIKNAHPEGQDKGINMDKMRQLLS